ncbi:MAG: MmgE/PrpD family protein [Gammaproteobacteria bacterium]|nr:MmgE/PrpD family protein [Gammaproteobacteria bacterium]
MACTKPYPSCGYTHRAIDAALELRNRNDLEFDAIESLDICVPGFYLDLLVYDVPADPAQAMFSAPYAVAATLLDGHFNLASLQDA